MVCGNVTTAGDLKKGVSEQECAEYCWSLPDCKAWSLYRFGSGYCYPYASSACIERNKRDGSGITLAGAVPVVELLKVRVF